MVQGFGFRGSGSGVQVQGFRFRGSGSEVQVQQFWRSGFSDPTMMGSDFEGLNVNP
jgi:hypothetical protein